MDEPLGFNQTEQWARTFPQKVGPQLLPPPLMPAPEGDTHSSWKLSPLSLGVPAMGAESCSLVLGCKASGRP